MLSLVRVLNHARPYSTLKRKSSPFHDLAAILFMFFRSRIEASHACIVGHTVYRKHVCRGPCIDRMSICVTTQIVEARDHLVLQTFVDNVLAPEVTHSVLNPFKVRHRDSTSVGQNVGYNKNPLVVKNL